MPMRARRCSWGRLPSSGLPLVSLPWRGPSVRDPQGSPGKVTRLPVAKPPPRTLTPEYQEATRQYLLAQNANPIRGLSSRKPQASEEE